MRSASCALLLLVGGLGAQEPTLRGLCFAYLEAEGQAAARAARTALAARDDLSLAGALAALDEGPLREAPRPGVQAGIPFVIPGTKIETTYDLFVPEGSPPKGGFPLWLGVHGTGGNGAGILPTLRRGLEKHRVMIACPTEAPDIRGQGWGFRHRERQLHIGLIDHLARRYPVDRSRVVVMGWSRGGHASWDVAMRYPDRFAGAGPIIGAPLMRDRALLPNLSSISFFAINGARDQKGLVDGARAGVARLRELGFPVKAIMDPTRGHAFFLDRLPELVECLMAARRDLAPRDFVFATRDLEYDRRACVVVKKLGKKAYRPGARMVIEGSSKMSEPERRAAYLREVTKRTPRVSVRFEEGTFTLTGTHVRQLELFVPLAFLEEGKPLSIVANGRTVKKKWRVRRPSPLQLLDLTREFGGSDTGYRFAAKTRVTFR